MGKQKERSIDSFHNIWEALCHGQSRSRLGLSFLENGGERSFPPSDVIQEALAYAAGLHEQGVRAGDRVGVLGHTCPEMVFSFLGCWALGAIPVPLSLPARALPAEAYLQQCARRLERVEAKLVAIPAEFRSLISGLDAACTVVSGEELRAVGAPTKVSGASHKDVALIQFTSGSTSEPRGVTLTQGAILANATAMTRVARTGPEDTLVSWLPIYHDMGLIGFVLTVLMDGMSLHLMTPQGFLDKPLRWLQAMSEKRATMTGAPNFAFGLAARVLAAGAEEPLDLSSLRLLLNGAEPIDPLVLERFIAAGAGYGLRPEAMYPVYGIAESTLAVTFPEPGSRYHVDWVSLSRIEEEQVAEPAEPDARGAVGFVALGRPLPGIEVSIRKSDSLISEERQVGEVYIGGRSLMSGYWKDAKKTREVLHKGWLRTGDLGYMADGQLYVVGRIKDIIIVGGRNIFPEDAERCVEQVFGVRQGNAVAFGVRGERGRERIVVVSETRMEGREAYDVARAATLKVRNELNIPLRETVLVPTGSIPKTSSGKKQRFLCREAYLAGSFIPVARYGVGSQALETGTAGLE